MIPLVNRYWACLLTAGFCAACAAPGATVVFHGADDYRFSRSERNTIEHIAEATALEARRVLPSLPADLVIRVYPDSDVIPETGESGSFLPPATVVWVVDPGHEGGVSQVTTSWLRASLLHELHHLVRSQTITSHSMMDTAADLVSATTDEVLGMASGRPGVEPQEP